MSSSSIVWFDKIGIADVSAFGAGWAIRSLFLDGELPSETAAAIQSAYHELGARIGFAGNW